MQIRISYFLYKSFINQMTDNLMKFYIKQNNFINHSMN